MIIGSFGALQLLVLAVMAVNIYWSVTTMRDVAKLQEAAAGVFRDVSASEKTQRAIGRDVVQLEKDLGVPQKSIRDLLANLPVAPKLVNATLHSLETELGESQIDVCLGGNP